MANEEKQLTPSEGTKRELTPDERAYMESTLKMLREYNKKAERKAKSAKILKKIAPVAATAAIIVSGFSIGSKIDEYAANNSYKTKIEDIVFNKYKDVHIELTQQLYDGDIDEEDAASLDKALAVLDEISAVKIGNDEAARSIHALVAEEKQFLSDFYKSCEISYSSGYVFTREEKAWAKEFADKVRKEQLLYRFRTEIGKLLS